MPLALAEADLSGRFSERPLPALTTLSGYRVRFRASCA